MTITILRNLDKADFDKTVWRYLSFPKYASILVYKAIWFSKLSTLIDEFEGVMPTLFIESMRREQELTRNHSDLGELEDRNVRDGRELTLASCWFMSDHDSLRMWKEYAPGNESVAIKSTVGSLAREVNCDSRFSCLGKVQYVDLDFHLTPYEANQAHLRAFLKREEFSREQEIRITTMSIRGPFCVNMDGTIPRADEYSGEKANNFENPGLYVQANISRLIHATVLAPNAALWFERLIKRMVFLSGYGGPVLRSNLEGT